MTNNTPPDPAVLRELIERVEAATPDDQREMLLAAWDEVNPEPVGEQAPIQTPRWINWSVARWNFGQLLKAGAFLDAAVKLVPEGWYWRAGHGVLWPGWAHLNRKHPDHCDYGDEHTSHAETPALALCAASLRARLSS